MTPCEGRCHCRGDIDECKLPSEENGCFGECINKMGSMECRCPHGTFGSPSVKGGCFKVKHSTTVQFVLHDYCNTSCGDVRVPYPFGIRPGCYRTGFNLTCNTSYNPPRLFLDSKGTLEVINISLLDSTVRVVHHTMTYTNATNLDEINTVIHFYIPDIGEPYALSIKNEFIFYGCNVQATLYGECNNDSISRIISSCNSTCRSSGNYLMYFYDRVVPLVDPAHHNGDYCHATIAAGSTPKRMDFKRLNLHTPIQKYFFMLAVAFLSEDGMTDQWHMTLNRMDLFNRPAADYMSSPLLLRWAVKKGFTASSASNSSGQCPREVANSLCRSQPSSCRQENGGFTCYCPKGYLGNPYITNGCIDIDECKITPKRCFGVCNNVPGKYKCRCKLGTFGNAKMPHGCVTLSVVLATFIKKNKIALSAASGPVLLLMGLGIILVPRKIEHHKMKLRKQKYFKQNRGQLLRQLVSQRADIAEKMIMTLDELAKATNNFDKDREIGGGGHGTVYKGILSDLHVVAIKKSKITVQKEIDEFINEVAILSQINHKNVVKLFGCCLETEVPLLVYEFISNGTLYHHLHIQGARSLSWDNRLRIATEIATSLAYLHSAVSIPIIHRDIKSTNVLLDDTLTAKVSDFGASRYIPIEKTGLTTRVQGTIGYLDPMYFQTNRLTEKSDVYSFGVILVELLTRKKPFSYLSPEGDGLVSHFLDLHVKAELFQIIDPQVIEEGGEEVQEVAALAASCINLLRGDERPTMRQVEHTLEGVRVSKMWKNHGMVAADLENDRVVFSCPSSTNNGQGFEESSRRYSLEQEMMMSVRYPR
nr:unnamed protein product [Digitaria exilis]